MGFNNKITSNNKTSRSQKRKKKKKLLSLKKDYNFFLDIILQVMMELKTRLFINQHLVR